MPYGELIHHLPVEEKRIIRKIEKTNEKLNSCKTAVLFNKVCLNEGLKPIIIIIVVVIIIIIIIIMIIIIIIIIIITNFSARKF